MYILNNIMSFTCATQLKVEHNSTWVVKIEFCIHKTPDHAEKLPNGIIKTIQNIITNVC